MISTSECSYSLPGLLFLQDYIIRSNKLEICISVYWIFLIFIIFWLCCSIWSCSSIIEETSSSLSLLSDCCYGDYFSSIISSSFIWSSFSTTFKRLKVSFFGEEDSYYLSFLILFYYSKSRPGIDISWIYYNNLIVCLVSGEAS